MPKVFGQKLSAGALKKDCRLSLASTGREGAAQDFVAREIVSLALWNKGDDDNESINVSRGIDWSGGIAHA